MPLLVFLPDKDSFVGSKHAVLLCLLFMHFDSSDKNHKL